VRASAGSTFSIAPACSSNAWGQKELGAHVVEVIGNASHYLSHALLANLPVTEVVTTNYDCLFEGASEDAGHPVRVLPQHAADHQPRWLLKMHGSVEQPG